MNTADERRATLLALYPLFKEEIYRRRQAMMRWTVIGSGTLLAVLLVIILAPSADRLSWMHRLMTSAGILVWTVTIVLVLLQQRHRHRQAKQTLIRIEGELGLFAGDTSGPQSLYPEHWQTDWQHDHSTWLALAILALQSLIAITAVLTVG